MKKSLVVLATISVLLTGCASASFNSGKEIPASSKFSKLTQGMGTVEVTKILRVAANSCKEVPMKVIPGIGLVEQSTENSDNGMGTKCEYKGMGTLYFAGALLDNERVLMKVDYNPESDGKVPLSSTSMGRLFGQKYQE